MNLDRVIFSLLSRCWTVGKAFGIAVRIHWSFWILPLVIGSLAWPHGWRAMAFTEAAVLIVYFCVLLHEYGHALTARAFGFRTEDIIMTPLGGIARLTRMPESPGVEILVAIAGPAVNVVIGSMLFLPVIFLAKPSTLLEQHKLASSWSDLFLMVTGGNIVLVLFNMLPIFPSDGGRVFRALLATFLSRVQATQAAVIVGAIGAFGLAIIGILMGSLQVPFIAVLLAFVAQMELWMVKRQEEMRGRFWIESHRFDAQQAAALEPPEPGFSGYRWEPRAQLWIEWRDGRAVRICGVHGW
jgi:Zn-dependent protease